MEADNIQAVIDTARAGTASKILAETKAVRQILVHGFGPHDSRIEALDLETGMDAPLRKRGTITVFDAASFNQVLKDNATAGDISIYFDRDPQAPKVVAVMNGHGTTGPGWCDFRAEIQFRPTPQWLKWQRHDGKLLPQVEFAEFIEDNIEDIAEPAGAVMLEIATYLEAVRTVNFRSGVRLSNGTVQLQHEQSDEAKVGASSVEVPDTFTLGIAPIFGLPSYRVPARFRYRLNSGKLTLGYKLQRTETMMSTIVEDVIAKIERGANISVLDGLPPDPPSPLVGRNASPVYAPRR